MELTLKPHYLIEKSRLLNKMVSKQKWKINEYRFLDAYLSKIDARYPETCRVRFSLDEFKDIFELGDSDVAKPSKLKPIAKSLVGHVMIEDYSQGDEVDVKSYVLFERCKIMRDSGGEWVVDIAADRRAMGLLFDLQDYFGCRLGLVAKLDTVPKRQFYNLLMHYEYEGEFAMPFDRLREYVCGKGSKYRYFDFKRYVIDKCKDIFEKAAGLRFEYERVQGAHNTTVSVRFYDIVYDDPYKQLTLDLDGETTLELTTDG